jgi:hypothetical protein
MFYSSKAHFYEILRHDVNAIGDSTGRTINDLKRLEVIKT